MKFNIKFLTFRKLYIHFCFLALLNIFFSTANVNAKSFSINDIEISTPLITGGSGHVGANLVRELSNRGYKVRCIDFDGDHRAFEGYAWSFCINRHC